MYCTFFRNFDTCFRQAHNLFMVGLQNKSGLDTIRLGKLHNWILNWRPCLYVSICVHKILHYTAISEKKYADTDNIHKKYASRMCADAELGWPCPWTCSAQPWRFGSHFKKSTVVFNIDKENRHRHYQYTSGHIHASWTTIWNGSLTTP